MNKSKKILTVLFVGLVGLLFSPLISPNYPAQAAIQKDERQGFLIDSFLNQTKSTVADTVKNDKSVLSSLKIFLGNLETAYDTKVLSEDDVKRIADALLFATMKNAQKAKNPEGEKNILTQSIDTANQLMNVSGDYRVDMIVSSLLLESVDQDEISLPEVKSHFGKTVEQLLAKVIDRSFDSQQATEISLASELATLGTVVAKAPPSWTPEKKEAYVLWVQEVVDQVPDSSSPELKKALNQKIKQHFDQQ